MAVFSLIVYLNNRIKVYFYNTNILELISFIRSQFFCFLDQNYKGNLVATTLIVCRLIVCLEVRLLYMIF